MDARDPARPGAPPLAVVFRTHSDIEASIVRGLLETHGIYAALSSDLTHAVFPLSIDGLGEVRVSVPAAQADDARAVIAQQGTRPQAGEVVRMVEARDLTAFEERVGHRFGDPQLLERALTHRSRANEDASGATIDNESLEFLGDAVLGFVMADLLFRDFPQLDEGQKSKIKASLVSTATLGDLARELGLGQYLALGRGEEKTGGRNKQALLADGYEALIAALYLDAGIDAARDFILREFGERLEDVRSPEFWGRDYKSALQEVVQSRELTLPEYTVAAESGPDHRKIFHVEVRVNGSLLGSARGASKKAAEQEAARQALERLGA
jgi:ribonuclease III